MVVIIVVNLVVDCIVDLVAVAVVIVAVVFVVVISITTLVNNWITYTHRQTDISTYRYNWSKVRLSEKFFTRIQEDQLYQKTECHPSTTTRFIQ